MKKSSDAHISKEPPTAHHGQLPWLVFSHGKAQKYQTFITAASAANSEHKNKHLCNIPQLCDKTILTCSRGWLVLGSNNNSQNYSLWNPVSFETINLPPLKNKGEYRCVLSSTCSNPESMVVLLFDVNHPRIICCRVRDRQKWSIQDISKELRYIDSEEGVESVATLENPVAMDDGIVYAIFETCCSTDDRLVRIKVIESTKVKVLVTSLQVSIPHIPHSVISYGKRLVESCGELLMVITSFWGNSFREVNHIQVFKMDFPQMSWVKMDNFKDRAIFLGTYYNLSCSVIDSEIKGNCIYFIGAKNEQRIYSFEKEDEILSILISDLNIQKLYSSNWIMPNLRHSFVSQVERDKKEGIENSEKEKEYEYCVKGAEKKEGGDEEEEAKLKLCDLPLDILECIGKRVTLVDYMNFRITCREFQMAAPAIQWRSRSASLGAEDQLLYPWFMLFKKDMKTCDLIDPKYNERYFINFPQQLLGATTHSSKNGWLLMSTAIDSFYFFNPLTKMIHPLPKNPNSTRPRITFSSSPTSPVCLVVGVSTMEGILTGVNVIRSRNGEWQEWENNTFDDENERFSLSNTTPVFYDERFWFFGKHGALGVVTVEEDGFGFDWKLLTKPTSPCKHFRINYLVQCDGHLFSIFVGSAGKRVRVFKLDLSTMSWVKVTSLGNHMFFLSYSSCFSMEAKIAGMENKIYFPRFYTDHSIIFYSLETQRFCSFTGQDATINFQLSKVALQCGWVESRWD